MPEAQATGRFVVQRHQARTLHYDFRLEKDGRFQEFAVHKGLPEQPGVQRLAIAAEHAEQLVFCLELDKTPADRGKYARRHVLVVPAVLAVL